MASPAPVSCCLIVKNEIGQIESCLKSLRPHVAEIVIVDTGSTDGTFDICAKYADVHERFSGCNDAEGRIVDFSVARQRSFDLATKKWVMWVDGDDEVVGADKLASIIESYEAQGADGPALLMFPYEYSHDEFGNVTCLHYRERVCSPVRSFKWVNPVHEVLTPTEGTNVLKTDDVRIIHRRQTSGKTIEPNRNLRILKAYYDRVGDSDTRQLYYLGLEYANAGDVRTSIEFHKKYVARSGWDDEKCLACLEIAKHHQTFGEYDQAIEWALRATTVKENWGEPYFCLGKSYYFLAQVGGTDARRNWERAVGFFRMGLGMPPTETILFVNPMERNYEVHKFLNLALNSVGDVVGALESAKKGLAADPRDQALASNIVLYESHLAKVTIAEKVNVLVQNNVLNRDAGGLVLDVVNGRVGVRPPSQDSAPAVAPAPVPAPVIPASSPGVVMATDTTSGLRLLPPPESDLPPSSGLRVSHNPLDIILYVGPGVEPWSPSTFAAGGIGGSETMAWEMARRLAAIGNRVRLFGDCQGMQGTYEGVEFVHHESYRDASCDVLITSRRPHAVDDGFNVRARARLCWVHDVHCGNSMSHARSLRLDRILCLSHWHKDVVLGAYPFMHQDQVIVTRNGIDLRRFSQPAQVRNPRRMIYSSSPDRGLQSAITAMPFIRERVPGAELHVFYGFKTWEAASQGNQDQLNIIALIKRLLEEGKQHGVHFHGRVDQSRLAREFLQSGVWGYPTWFTETSCITAMEAQAAGLRVVTSPIAALNETVGPRGAMIHGDWLSPEYRVAYVNAVVDAMTRTDESDRAAIAEHARSNFGLDGLAEEWDDMLHRVLDEVERDIVVPYKVVG